MRSMCGQYRGQLGPVPGANRAVLCCKTLSKVSMMLDKIITVELFA